MVLCYPAVFFELDLVQIRSGGTDSYCVNCVWQLRAARLLLVVLVVVILILSYINIILSYIFFFKYARA